MRLWIKVHIPSVLYSLQKNEPIFASVPIISDVKWPIARLRMGKWVLPQVLVSYILTGPWGQRNNKECVIETL